MTYRMPPGRVEGDDLPTRAELSDEAAARLASRAAAYARIRPLPVPSSDFNPRPAWRSPAANE